MKQFFSATWLFIFCLFSNLICFSQQPELAWAKSITASTYTEGDFIVADHSGNVYTAGRFNGTPDFDPGPGVYNLTSTSVVSNASNMFISKLDASGNFLWAKSFPNPDYEQIASVVLDSAGDYLYVSGFFYGTVDFDPGPGTFNMTSAGFGDFFILKLDAGGNFIWAKQIGSVGAETYLRLAIHGTRLYMSSNFSDTVDFDPGPGVYNVTAPQLSTCFIDKLDTAGTFISVVIINGPAANAVISSMCVDLFGNLISTGSFGGPVDFDPGPGTHIVDGGDYSDMFVLKFDSSLNFVWISPITALDYLSSQSLAVDLLGNVIISGEMRSTVDFDPGPGVYNLTSEGLTDNFVCKLNAAGGLEWVDQLKNNQFGVLWRHVVDNSGNVYATGSLQGTVDFDPGPNVYNLTSFGYNDFFIWKINPSGELAWAKNMGNSSSDDAFAIFVDPSYNIYVTGYFASVVDFDPGPADYYLTSSGTNQYILKLAQPGILPLTLLDFSAKAVNNQKVALQWQTVQEQYTDKFIVERSSNQRDFMPVGSVAAAGNSPSAGNYFFTDKDPLPGIGFYRLKMLDKNGLFTYSDIEAARINKTAFHIYPNPAKESLRVDASGKNTMAVLQIIDIPGKVVKEENILLNGPVSVTLNIEGLPAGKYHAVLQTKDGKHVIEFIKL